MQEDENTGHRPTRRHRRARRKLSKFAYFLILFILLLIATVFCVSVFFNIDTIRISGKSPYSSAQVTSASGIKIGTNLFRIDKNAASKKISSLLPFVADAKIKLWPPSSVKIEITADSPKYVIKSAKQYAYADENLKALDISNNAKKYTGVITINGVEITDFKPGAVISFKDKTQAATIKTLMAAIKEAGLSKITSLDVTDGYQLSIVYDSRINIILGTSLEADKKLEAAAAIINSKIQSSDKGSLDVSAQNKRYTFSPS